MANIRFAPAPSGLGCACDAGPGLSGLGAQPYLDDYSYAEQIDELEPLEPLPRTEPPQRRSRPRRKLKHGSTVWCVFMGRGKKARKKSCHTNKFSADKAARSLKAARYRGSQITVRKSKHKMKCPFGGRRVCRSRKGGACVQYGCAGMKKGKRRKAS